jgi:tetratricopeptide (TPR) repeat protein
LPLILAIASVAAPANSLPLRSAIGHGPGVSSRAYSPRRYRRRQVGISRCRTRLLSGFDLPANGGHDARMSDESAKRIYAAIESLRAGDRAIAAGLLQEELRLGPASGERWKSIHRLAAQIGETDTALEAARRYSRTEPTTLERRLFYCAELAACDRLEEARAEIALLPPSMLDHPSVLHFLGTVARQEGDFEESHACFRRALTKAPDAAHILFALAMSKTFTRDDRDLAALDRAVGESGQMVPLQRARLLYGAAKAWHDCGEFDRAWELYAEGAALRRAEQPWNADQLTAVSDALVRDFTAEGARQLTPVERPLRPALFVNGLPRSGTTLVEQIIASHPDVGGGAEINFLRPALIPTGDYSLRGALTYQARFGAGDPWGALASDYFRMLRMRFRTDRLVVDKTLGQSHYMGLLLHMLPEAKVIWMRRDPQDVALSCFQTFFTEPLTWSWSLDDIARYFAIEDRLFAHWISEFPDRILVVPYEGLAREPENWIDRILAHAGLSPDPGVFDFHKTKRSVQTASVSQVREPISTGRIGLSRNYEEALAPFRAAYFG